MSPGIDTLFEVSGFSRFHYLELSAGNVKPAVPRDSWELIYVDKGKISLCPDGQTWDVECGNGLLLRPGDNNSIHVDHKMAANLHCIAFDLFRGDPTPLTGNIFALNAGLRAYIKLILKEAKFAYRNDLRNPDYVQLDANPKKPFGAEQMMKTLMEQLLIGLIRQTQSQPQQNYRELVRESMIMNNLGKNPFFDGLVVYLEQNIDKRLTIDQICKDNLTNRSKVQRVFKECTLEGVIGFHQILKIEYAKIMIRETNMNITQISAALGFSSVHHFSKKFKQLVKMSPSEYARFAK